MDPRKVKSSVFSRFINYKNVLTHLYPKKWDFSNVLIQREGENRGSSLNSINQRPSIFFFLFFFFEIDFVKTNMSTVLGA